MFFPPAAAGFNRATSNSVHHVWRHHAAHEHTFGDGMNQFWVLSQS